ncbi:MAG: 30S ribosomal protein S20 [bacterium]|nr:30S ribosomal protein S20 [bacterium]MDZ4248443.1 30S ribosomal protein S20 [Patescibacteria group bacterium]
MPQIKSAKKRVKVAARQAEKNTLHRSRARTALKQVRTLAAAGKAEEAAKALPAAQKYLDKAAKVRAIHPRTAARYKSRVVDVLKRAKTKPAAAQPAAKAASKKPAAKTAVKKPAAKKTATKKVS